MLPVLPPTDYTFDPGQVLDSGSVAKLQLNEVAYDPAGSDTGREWLEIKNIGNIPIDFSHERKIYIGLDTRQTRLTYVSGEPKLDPGCYLIVARDPSQLPIIPESSCSLIYRGSLTLPNRLVDVGLVVENEKDIRLGSYDPVVGGRGNDRTLERDQGGVWRASMALGGTPGADFRALEPELVPHIVISHFSAAPISGEIETITLKNIDQQPINLAGWELDDRAGGSKAFRFPTSSYIGAGQEKVLLASETHLSLTDTGDEIWLRDAQGRTIDFVSYGRIERGTTWQRSASGVGEWFVPGDQPASAQLTPAPIVHQVNTDVQIIDQVVPRRVNLDAIPDESGWHLEVHGVVTESHAKSADLADGTGALHIQFRLEGAHKPSIHRGDILIVRGILEYYPDPVLVVTDPGGISVQDKPTSRSKRTIRLAALAPDQMLVSQLTRAPSVSMHWHVLAQSPPFNFSTIWPVLGMLGGLLLGGVTWRSLRRTNQS